MRGEKSPKNETTISCAFRLRRVILYSMTAAFYLLAMVFFYKAYNVKINCAKSIYAISAADAGVYNRIINGSNFSGYAVIAAMGAICGTICLHGGIMCENYD